VKFATIIFDLDGTISDPLVGIAGSINYALAAYDYDAVETERIKPLIGPPLTFIFEHLLGRVTGSRMSQLVDKYRERYATEGYAENQIYEQIADTVRTLSARDYKLGVCTSKRADYATRIVEMFGLGQYFAFVNGGGDGIEKIDQLGRLVANGLQPESAIMVGDRDIDINAAKGNSIASVGVAWGFGSRDELRLANPDYLVETPADLLALFN